MFPDLKGVTPDRMELFDPDECELVENEDFDNVTDITIALREAVGDEALLHNLHNVISIAGA